MACSLIDGWIGIRNGSIYSPQTEYQRPEIQTYSVFNFIQAASIIPLFFAFVKYKGNLSPTRPVVSNVEPFGLVLYEVLEVKTLREIISYDGEF